jgi:predicted dehydrogenase
MSIKREFPEWFFDKDRSGGGLIDQATHNLDMLRHLFGEVTEVVGAASNPRRKKKTGYTIDETIGLTFQFENGMLGTHSHTWVGDTWRNYLALSGEKRHYTVDMWKEEITVLEGRKTTTIGFTQEGMYTHENALFLEMLKSGDWSSNMCDYDDGLATLRLTLAADRSITDGKVTL